jgi:HSP20 family protein
MHRFIKIRLTRDFERLEEQVRRCLGTYLESRPAEVSFRPAADFYETSDGLLLRLDLAGVQLDQVAISLAGQELVIRGRRPSPPAAGVRRFIHLETAFGSFERTFILPIPIDAQGVEARYVDGVLEIRLPRKSPPSRQIPITQVAEPD